MTACKLLSVAPVGERLAALGPPRPRTGRWLVWVVCLRMCWGLQMRRGVPESLGR